MKISEGMKRWIEFCRKARIHNLYLLAISNRDKKEITIPGSTPTPHPYPDPFSREPAERFEEIASSLSSPGSSPTRRTKP